MKNLLWGIGLVSIAASASGQAGSRPSPENVIRGQGEIKIEGRRNESITEAVIDMRDRGSFDITVRGRSSYTFSGKVLRRSGENIFIRIDTAMGRRAGDANGRIQGNAIRGGYRSLRFGGEVDGRIFEVSISDRQNELQKGQRENYRSYESNRRGRGNLTVNGRSYRISQATINLERNGEARVVFRGEKDVTLKGKWRSDGLGRATVDIREAFDSSNSRGDVRIYLNGDSFTRIELSGTSRRDRFDGSFSSSD